MTVSDPRNPAVVEEETATAVVEANKPQAGDNPTTQTPVEAAEALEEVAAGLRSGITTIDSRRSELERILLSSVAPVDPEALSQVTKLSTMII